MKSELLAISTSLDVHWFSVSEIEREKSEEPSGEDEDDTTMERERAELVIESLAVLKKKDLGTELRQFDCCECEVDVEEIAKCTAVCLCSYCIYTHKYCTSINLLTKLMCS